MGQSAERTLNTGCISSELGETKGTFELGSNINETTTLGGDLKEKDLPMSTRVSRRKSQMTQQSVTKCNESIPY